MFLDKRIDVAHTLFFQDFINGNQDAGLLHITKTIVDGCAEELHRRRQRHIGVDKRRDVVAQGTHLAVEDEVVFLEVVLAEQLLQFVLRCLYLKRLEWDDKVLLVVEVLLEEAKYHVSASADVGWIHRHLAEEVAHVRLDDGKGAQSVP